MPAMGARKLASCTALRDKSAAARAACNDDRAPAALLTDVSSAVRLMKPWLTSAWLLASVFSAMSSCALAAPAWSSAWRKRIWYSVSSSRPINWPALTRSPSRTLMSRTSAATLERSMALLTARRLPDTASCVVSSLRCAMATSLGARSMARSAALAALAAADVLARPCIRARAARPTSTNAINATTIQTLRRLMWFWLCVLPAAASSPRPCAQACKGHAARDRGGSATAGRGPYAGLAPGRHRRSGDAAP